MKGRKISTVVLCIVFALSIIFTLTACMNEDDYYNKGDIDSLVDELQAELLSKTNETNAAITALKAEYEAEKAVLQATAKSNTDKIAQLTVDYSVKVAALEKADADNSAEIAALKSSYETELAKLKAADEDNAAAIAALDKEYGDKVTELEADLKSSSEAINLLIEELRECDDATAETVEAMQTQIEMILAAMEKQYHTVTFVTDGDTVAPEAQSVIDGKKATKPADPKKQGYIFDGWFMDGERWSFIGYVVTEDITLTATWKECTEHIAGDDFYCTICGTYTVVALDYPWDNQTLIFQLSENTNNNELSSGCHRYLAGDIAHYYELPIDIGVDRRNTNAKIATKIDVIYLYWDNTKTYGLGKCIDRIEEIVNSKTVKNAPDVYVNFMYDMVGCAVKGCFANLKGTSRGTGKLAGLNYFEFNDPDYDESVNNRGYMNDWMNSLTLSRHKSYILGSDYFTDIVRAEFVIPVGIDLLNEFGEDITGDRNGDGEFTIDDFYEQVYAGEWTYDLLMDYSEAVWRDYDNSAAEKCWIGDNPFGFAISDGDIAASGLLYTTSVSLIEKRWNVDTNDWECYYPEDNESLGNFHTAVQELFEAPGVAYVKNVTSGDYDISSWGGVGSSAHIEAIRNIFSLEDILFGDIVTLGTLEHDEYQMMRERSSFGVVVVPLYDKDAGYKKDAPYLTQIHNMARPGAIAKNTTKFVECTAYLNYQSTHSTKIIDEYYEWVVANGLGDSTINMLQYARANIRDSFDKAMEDAIGVFAGEEAYSSKVLVMVTDNDWQTEDIRGAYKEVLTEKRAHLADLLRWFESAAD